MAFGLLLFVLTRRSQRGLGALVGELPCQAVPDLVMREKSSVNGLSRAQPERFSHLCEEIGLLVVAGDLHALERAVEPDIDVEVTGILVEVKERAGSPREIAALALPQLGELT